VRTVLTKSLAMRGRSRLRQIVEGAWLALGGPACVDAPTDLEDARVYLDLLDELEEGGDITDTARLAEQVSELYALPDVTASDALQLMTIHKAKGLEFDTVILPGLGSPPRHDDPPLLRWMETPHSGGAGYPADLLLAPIRETGGEHDLLYNYLGRLEKDKSRFGRLPAVCRCHARWRTTAALPGAEHTDGTAASSLALLWPVIEGIHTALEPEKRLRNSVRARVTCAASSPTGAAAAAACSRLASWCRIPCRKAAPRSSSTGRAKPSATSAAWCTAPCS
jgi:hypothetical protein